MEPMKTILFCVHLTSESTVQSFTNSFIISEMRLNGTNED